MKKTICIVLGTFLMGIVSAFSLDTITMSHGYTPAVKTPQVPDSLPQVTVSPNAPGVVTSTQSLTGCACLVQAKHVYSAAEIAAVQAQTWPPFGVILMPPAPANTFYRVHGVTVELQDSANSLAGATIGQIAVGEAGYSTQRALMYSGDPLNGPFDRTELYPSTGSDVYISNGTSLEVTLGSGIPSGFTGSIIIRFTYELVMD
jgi:hypothetical protein